MTVRLHYSNARRGRPATGFEQRYLAALAAAWRGPGGPAAAEAAARDLLVSLVAGELARRGQAAALTGSYGPAMAAPSMAAWADIEAGTEAGHWARLRTELRSMAAPGLAALLAKLATGMTADQRQQGAFATPPEVADLLVAWAVRDAGACILDPACGAGALLARAAAWSEARFGPRAGRMRGVESDAAQAALARLVLCGLGRTDASVHVADFLALPLPTGEQQVDAIIANPPFVRHEQIMGDTAARHTLRQVSGLGGRADLHAYFWPALAMWLRPGGRAAVVTPFSWLEADYGRELRQYLLDHFALEAIIEPAAERWFADASIHTALVLVRRCAEPRARAATRTRLMRLRRPLAELLGPEGQRWEAAASLVRRLDALTADEDGADWQVRLVAAAQLAAEETAPRRRGVARMVGLTDRSDQSLPVGLPWGGWLRAPGMLIRLLTDRAARWVRLGELARVRYPLKTGADRFFYLTSAEAAVRGIEADCLRPVVRTPRELAGLTVEPTALTWRVLIVPPAPLAELPSGVRRYIQAGEAAGLARRPTCAGRRPWYALPPLEPAPLLWPRFIDRRHTVWLNGGGALENQTFYGVLADADTAAVLAAVLNSTLGALVMEVFGRSNLGDGALQYAVGQAAAVPVPDVACLSPVLRSALLEALQAASRVRSDGFSRVDGAARAALDDLTLQALGIEDRTERLEVAAAVREGLDGLVAERLRRGRRRRQ